MKQKKYKKNRTWLFSNQSQVGDICILFLAEGRVWFLVLNLLCSNFDVTLGKSISVSFDSFIKHSISEK